MTDIRKRQHYLPEKYLEGFCIQPNKLWQYDKSQPSNPDCSSPKNLAVQNYYYSYQDYDGTRNLDSVEKALEALIESPTNKILPKLLSQQPLGKAEKYQVTEYLCVMWSRVPAYRQTIDTFLRNLNTEPIIEKWNSEVTKSTPERETELRQFLDASKDKTPDKMYAPIIIPEVVNILAEMNWYYITSSSPIVVIGDNPFCFTSQKGLAAPDAEFFFPIARDCILWGCKKMPLKQNQWYCFLRDDVARKANEWQIRNAVKYIFYGEKENWVIDLIRQLTENE